MKFPVKKTAADIPPDVASEYAKAPRGQAIAEATGDGYTATKAMQGSKSPSQLGLPKSPGKKKPPMKMSGRACA